MNSYIFEKQTLNAFPRLISLLDRDKNSPAYGCFDRAYWHYKLSSDFPSAVFQQGVLPLALAYANDFAGNIYFKNKTVLEYIKAGMSFWADIQNPDGSFNEWYPNEHSYVATAFTAYGISGALRIILAGGDAPAAEGKVIRALIKSGKWLMKNKDLFLSNHIAGSIAALNNIYLVTGGEEFKRGAKHKLEELLGKQDPEGWFTEYGGADIGYQSVTIDFLAKYYKDSGDSSLEAALEKALEFTACFVHPDGTSGGEYASRNTKYLMPHGFEILRGKFKTAAYIADILRRDFEERSAYLSCWDDRYFVFFFFPNFLHAWLENKGGKRGTGSGENYGFDKFARVFKNAGLVSVKNAAYHFICNYKKGGAVKVFRAADKGGIILNQSGYFGKFAEDRAISSQWLDNTRKDGVFSGAEYARDNPAFGGAGLIFEFQQEFVYVDYSLPLERWLIPLRIFNRTLGKLNVLAAAFSSHIKKKHILSREICPVLLRRKVTLKEDEIVIEDRLVKKAGVKLLSLRPLADCSLLHVPSSKYFTGHELESMPDFDLSAALNQKGEARARFTIAFPAEKCSLVVEVEGERVRSRELGV